jgi:hypothetical protein
MAISFILLTFGIVYGHLVLFVVKLVYFPRFGILNKEKSGNPERVKKMCIAVYSYVCCDRCKAGLPDGTFAFPKFQFGYILEGLGMDNVSHVL